MLNERPTPETDAETMSDGVETLTNQSDSTALYQKLCDAVYEIQGLRRERDEARAMAKDMASQFWQAESKAERYCQERDKARDAIMKIEEIFVDGENTHDDWFKMGSIAREYFKK